MGMLKPGKLQALSPHVHRLIAPNPGPMTGPGTNTYFVGKDRVAVIDPGPSCDEHIDAILSALERLGPLETILVTHSHPDHSPAAASLAAKTGARLCGPFRVDYTFQDESYFRDEEIQHDQLFTIGGVAIRAVHTPGHVSNHFCFLIEEEGLLLTGDHIMSGSTVVIIPPGGDMQDYIASLRLLLDYPLASLGPGHGDVIISPYDEIRHIIDHRMAREAKVLDVMQNLVSACLDDLTPRVYDDVDTSLHPIARLSLHAHLIKLEKEQVLGRQGEQWQVRR